VHLDRGAYQHDRGSPKVEQPFPPEDGIGILTTGDASVAVLTVLIQGNLARPRDLTRRGRSSRQKSEPK
jgi:hypothetical protein